MTRLPRSISAQPTTRLLLALRHSLSQLHTLRPAVPYSTARLTRLAVQIDYFLDLWPVAHWPVSTQAGDVAPTKAEAVNLLSQAQRLLVCLPHTPQSQQVAAWQQAASLIRKAITPFV